MRFKTFISESMRKLSDDEMANFYRRVDTSQDASFYHWTDQYEVPGIMEWQMMILRDPDINELELGIVDIWVGGSPIDAPMFEIPDYFAHSNHYDAKLNEIAKNIDAEMRKFGEDLDPGFHNETEAEKMIKKLYLLHITDLD